MTNIDITIRGFYEAVILLGQQDQHKFTHLMSFRDSQETRSEPDAEAKIPGFDRVTNAIERRFDDISYDAPALRENGYIPPSPGDAQAIIDFARAARDSKEDIKLLSHCAAGVSRSTAAAYIFMCIQLGPGHEKEAFDAVVAARSFARPNKLLCQHADWILRPEFGGRIYEVSEAETEKLRRVPPPKINFT